ncbi:MAG: DUF2520 domain-containing protein [Peptococcaceae bacterium]|nr:DUF2520 domain-containing protein [Peptococcaceae bacterium]
MIDFSKQIIAIVGAGKVGTALALLLGKKGYPVSGVVVGSKHPDERLVKELQTVVTRCPEEVTIKADVVFITTPDRLIATVTKEICAKGGFRAGQIVLHASGSQSADDLGAAREFGASVASIHPLQSFAHVDVAIEHLPGSYFALEGDEPALKVAEQIVGDLNGFWFAIAGKDKPLYHAAACIASNYLVSLMHFATGLYQHFGLSRKEAFGALLPLIQGTINNMQQLTTTNALTGPIARGDDQTVARHLAVLADVGEQERELYRVMARYTTLVALEKGSINQEQAAKLEELCKVD